MQIVIDIPQGLKIDFENEQWTALTCVEMKDALQSGIILPENAANGDIIKAMFPNMKVGFITENQIGVYYVKNAPYATVFDLDWWNAPYKAEREGV